MTMKQLQCTEIYDIFLGNLATDLIALIVHVHVLFYYFFLFIALFLFQALHDCL